MSTLPPTKEFQIFTYDRDVIHSIVGPSMTGKTHLMNHILNETENMLKPSFGISPNGDDFEEVTGRVVVETPEQLLKAIDCSHVEGRSCPTLGTVIYNISLKKGWEDELSEVFKLSDWWADELKAQFPDGSRKLSLFLPDIKSYVTNNSAPPNFRYLLTRGRHRYRIHLDTQSTTHQPSYIISNSNAFSVFQTDVEGHIKKITTDIKKEINDETMEQLDEFEFFHYDKKLKAFYRSKI